MEYLESPNNRFQNQINNKLRRSSDLQRCCSNGTSQTFDLFFSKGLLLYTQRCVPVKLAQDPLCSRSYVSVCPFVYKKCISSRKQAQLIIYLNPRAVVTT